jgi:hypothetical protein
MSKKRKPFADRRYESILLAASVGLGLLPAQSLPANTMDSWANLNGGNWNNPNNWLGNSVPAQNDFAYITNTFTDPRQVLYDGSPTITTGEIYLDCNPGLTNTFVISSNDFPAGVLNVGVNGTSSVNQSGATSSIGNVYIALNAGSTGNYNFSNGTGQIVEWAVGNSGNGNLNQSGGSISSTYFYVGLNTGSTGTYTLSSGQLQVTGDDSTEVIGNSGLATVNQTGGTNTFANFNMSAGAGSISTYNLSGGQINCVHQNFYPNEIVGGDGNATFNQNGGVNTGNGGNAILFVGDDGGSSSYTLSGGSMSFLAERVGSPFVAAWFSQSGGTNTMSSGLEINGRDYFGSATSSYTLTGGILNVATDESVGPGSFNQSGGVNTLTSGNGFLSIGPNSRTTGAYVLSGGTLSAPGVYVGGDSNAAAGSGSMSVSGSGNFQVSGTLTVWNTGTVTLGGPSSAYTTVGNLQIAAGGVIDVTNTGMTINYGTNPSPNAAVRNYISTGYNAVGSLWTGSGITSSSAAANPGHRSVAFADGGDGIVTKLPAGISSAIPNGGALPAGSEVVTYAYAGDANLDGKVDFNDFVAISTHFLTNDINWDHGNFNYDGVVDFNDFVVLSTNFGEGVTGGDGVGATPEELAQFNALATSDGVSSTQIKAWDATISNLPEPTSAGLLVVGASVLMHRRHRRTISLRRANSFLKFPS